MAVPLLSAQQDGEDDERTTKRIVLVVEGVERGFDKNKHIRAVVLQTRDVESSSSSEIQAVLPRVSMSEAVEGAELMLYGVSEKYKER